MRPRHVAYLSPCSSWYSLKLSLEGKTLLFDDVGRLFAEAYKYRTYLVVQARPLVSEAPGSLHIMSNASGQLPSVPWQLWLYDIFLDMHQPLCLSFFFNG